MPNAVPMGKENNLKTPEDEVSTSAHFCLYKSPIPAMMVGWKRKQ